MEKELKNLLEQILDNQVILYRKIDMIEQKVLRKSTKMGYNYINALDDLAKDIEKLSADKALKR